ncbi:MAG TPA: ABC transporter permease subunit [Chloroflexota bacterium]|jgi:iron(III) transport system permease protein
MAVTDLSISVRQSAERVRAAPWRWIGGVVLVALALATVAPIAFIVLNSLNAGRPGDAIEFSLQGWQEAFGDTPTLQAILYTGILLLRVPVALVVALVLAWLLVRASIPCRGFIELSFWLAYFLPHLPIAVSWILLLDPNYGLVNQWLLQPLGLPFNIYSLGGITWVHLTTSTIPVMLILLAPMLRQMDPSLEEAAGACGASWLAIFRRIIVPIMAPGLVAVFIAGIIRGLEALQIELLLGTPSNIYVFSTRIYDLVHWEPARWAPAMALSTTLLGILFLLALLNQRVTARGYVATISGKASGYRPVDIGLWRWVIGGGLVAYLLISVYLPLATLVLGSLMRLFGFFNVSNPFSLIHWQRVLGNTDFEAAVRTSLLLGVAVAGLGVIVYGLLAYLLTKTPMPGKGVANLLVWLPWGVPGLLLGLAFLWMLLAVPLFWPLYGTVMSLVLVLFMQEMPIGVQMAKAAFGQVGQELEEAARVCGASWLTTYRRVLLPLVAPMLVSIFMIVFMAAVRAIDSVILLGSSTTRPLSLLMLEYSLAGHMESAAIVGLILSAMALALGLASRRFGVGLGGR